MYKKEGGECRKRFQKGGTGRACPLPKSATDYTLETMARIHKFRGLFKSMHELK